MIFYLNSAPPLAILPLVAREIKLWLDGSSERVAVLHCKGTQMNNFYFLSLSF